jgi:hypothetical protein
LLSFLSGRVAIYCDSVNTICNELLAKIFVKYLIGGIYDALFAIGKIQIGFHYYIPEAVVDA